jgi:hypothetical protein
MRGSFFLGIGGEELATRQMQWINDDFPMGGVLLS